MRQVRKSNSLRLISEPDSQPTPLLTVVVPVFNRERFLEDCLRSIEAQTARPLRVVIVDNASRDRSPEIMRLWAERVQAPDFQVTLLNESRPGAASARNRGLDAVETPWVMFFDSDDLMAPNHVADFQACIERHPDADLVGRKVGAYSPEGRKLYTGLFTTKDPEFNHLLHGILSTQRWAARTELIRKVGAWDSRVMAWDDLEIGLRILLANPVMYEVSGKPSVHIVVHDNSITGSCFSLSPSKWLNALDICEHVCRDAHRPDLVRWVDARCAILAANLRREGSRSDAARIMKGLLRGKSTSVTRRLKALYHIQRLVGHGASTMTRFLFPQVNR